MVDSTDSSPSHFVDQHFTPTAITATLPIVATISNHGLQNGQAMRATRFVTMPFARATGMEQLNNRMFYVQQATTDTFQLYTANGFPIDGRSFTPFVNNGLAQFTRVGPTLPVVNPAPPPPPGVPPLLGAS